MPFVQAKCPNCGGMLAVDDSKKAAICQFCGDAFVVEDAVNNYNTYNITNQNIGEGAVVNIYENQNSIFTIMERAFMFLEEGDLVNADEYCEKALDLDPKCEQAYLCKLMVDLKIKKESDFDNVKQNYEDNKNYQKLISFGNEEIKSKLKANLVRIKNEREELIAKRNHLAKVEGLISAGFRCTFGVKNDGTVVSTEFIKTPLVDYSGQCDVDDWTDVVAVAAGKGHTLGVKADGTVLATGRNGDGECNVSDWTDIVAVSCGSNHSVGLQSNGKVIATKYIENKFFPYCGQCGVYNWTDIVAIAAGHEHTLGVKADGTVLATGRNGEGQCNVSEWTDIVAVSCGVYHSVGLKSNGTVVASEYIGKNSYKGQCDVTDWTDIVAISAGDDHTVGLKSDGTVVAVGRNGSGQCDVSGWTDVVAVCAGSTHTIGLKVDGTIAAAGETKFCQCNVGDWKLFDDINSLEEERKNKKEQRLEEERRIAEEKRCIEDKKAQYRSQGLCQHCGGEFKGFISKKCVKCGNPKDY